jgi:PAS domain S-box-containing protein
MDIENINLENASRADLEAFVVKQNERNERISFALEATESGIWQWDTNKKEIYMSSESYALMGYSLDDQIMTYNDFFENVHPEDRYLTDLTVKKYVEVYPESHEIELRVKHKNGNFIWLNSIGKLKDKVVAGQEPIIIGSVYNVDRRKKLETELLKYQKHLESLISERTGEIEKQNVLLKDRERAYGTLLENLQGMAYRFLNDGKWTMLYASDGCEELTGYSAGKFIQGTVKMERDVLVDEFSDSVWEHITTALNEKKSFKISYPIITKSGDKKWVLDRGVGVYDSKGGLVNLEGVIVDITEQKNQELQYQLAQKTIDNAPIAIQWIKEDGSYHYVNQTALNYSGYTKADFEKIKIYDIDPLLDENGWRSLFNERMTSPASDIESSYVGKNGHLLPVLVNASNIEFEGVIYNCSYINEISALKLAENKLREAYDEISTSEEELRQRTEELNTLNDNLEAQKGELESSIFKLREAQDQLVQAEKMASLGVLVAGIAHELNNPINYLSTGGEGLKIIIEDVLKVVNTYNEITAENISEKLIEINELKSELDFEELLTDMTKMTTNINMGAEQASDIIRGLKSFSRMDTGMLSNYDIHNGIDNVLLMLYSTFKFRVKVVKKYGNIPEIECYPAKLGQVFMNLVSNAIQAIEGEGEVIISTYIEHGDVVVDVKDSGVGIPDHITNRLFEPFFTTKDTGQGTGLGLSISMGIMEDHHGRIEFYNNEDKGATFKIYLPQNQPKPQ